MRNSNQIYLVDQNLTQMPNLAKICERFNDPNTVGAAIATATLKDYVITSDDNIVNLIDRSKL